MGNEPSNAPSDHSETSFNIIPDDVSSGRLVHEPNPSGEDRVLNKLLNVLSSTTQVLAQNQVILSNLSQAMEAGIKDARQVREVSWLNSMQAANGHP